MKPPIPKKQWGPGPWQKEPDGAQFVHAGLQCYVFRNTWVTGSLNGYVAIRPEHPWWGKNYGECVAVPPCDPNPPVDFDAWPHMPPPGSRLRAAMAEPSWSCDHRPDALIDVHGGLTYGGPMPEVLGPRDMEAWGFGFDTGHAGDLMPLMEATLKAVYLLKKNGAAEWAAHQRIMKQGPLGETYKTMSYVRQETKRLAEQLAKFGRKHGSGTWTDDAPETGAGQSDQASARARSA